MPIPVLIGLQGNEIWIIAILVLVLFGATAIPKLARALGRAQGEFKTAKAQFDKERVVAEAEATKGAAPVNVAEAHSAPTAAVDDALSPSEKERRLRAAAREMGIDEAGMSTEQVRAELDRRL